MLRSGTPLAAKTSVLALAATVLVGCGGEESPDVRQTEATEAAEQSTEVTESPSISEMEATRRLCEAFETFVNEFERSGLSERTDEASVQMDIYSDAAAPEVAQAEEAWRDSADIASGPTVQVLFDACEQATG